MMLKKMSVITAVIAVVGMSSVPVLAASMDQPAQTVSAEKKISMSDAKKLVRKYLKSKKAYRKLRVGQVDKKDNQWKVKINSSNGIPVLTAHVDDKTGEITFKR
ncbi:MAG: hypothetical protein GXP00_04670 [Alphaproteobacteria bacterium]|nr:hypothetical protein [Alphaproteobacteria bacterium]